MSKDTKPTKEKKYLDSYYSKNFIKRLFA